MAYRRTTDGQYVDDLSASPDYKSRPNLQNSQEAQFSNSPWPEQQRRQQPNFPPFQSTQFLQKDAGLSLKRPNDNLRFFKESALPTGTSSRLDFNADPVYSPFEYGGLPTASTSAIPQSSGSQIPRDRPPASQEQARARSQATAMIWGTVPNPTSSANSSFAPLASSSQPSSLPAFSNFPDGNFRTGRNTKDSARQRALEKEIAKEKRRNENRPIANGLPAFAPAFEGTFNDPNDFLAQRLGQASLSNTSRDFPAPSNDSGFGNDSGFRKESHSRNATVPMGTSDFRQSYTNSQYHPFQRDAFSKTAVAPQSAAPPDIWSLSGSMPRSKPTISQESSPEAFYSDAFLPSTTKPAKDWNNFGSPSKRTSFAPLAGTQEPASNSRAPLQNDSLFVVTVLQAAELQSSGRPFFCKVTVDNEEHVTKSADRIFGNHPVWSEDLIFRPSSSFRTFKLSVHVRHSTHDEFVGGGKVTMPEKQLGNIDPWVPLRRHDRHVGNIHVRLSWNSPKLGSQTTFLAPQPETSFNFSSFPGTRPLKFT